MRNTCTEELPLTEECARFEKKKLCVKKGTAMGCAWKRSKCLYSGVKPAARDASINASINLLERQIENKEDEAIDFIVGLVESHEEFLKVNAEEWREFISDQLQEWEAFLTE